METIYDFLIEKLSDANIYEIVVKTGDKKSDTETCYVLGDTENQARRAIQSYYTDNYGEYDVLSIKQADMGIFVSPEWLENLLGRPA